MQMLLQKVLREITVVDISYCFSCALGLWIESEDRSSFSQILVQGRAGLNRAIDGDTVAVELLPEAEWTAPSDIVLQDDETADPGMWKVLII